MDCLFLPPHLWCSRDPVNTFPDVNSSLSGNMRVSLPTSPVPVASSVLMVALFLSEEFCGALPLAVLQLSRLSPLGLEFDLEAARIHDQARHGRILQGVSEGVVSLPVQGSPDPLNSGLSSKSMNSVISLNIMFYPKMMGSPQALSYDLETRKSTAGVQSADRYRKRRLVDSLQLLHKLSRHERTWCTNLLFWIIPFELYALLGEAHFSSCLMTDHARLLWSRQLFHSFCRLLFRPDVHIRSSDRSNRVLRRQQPVRIFLQIRRWERNIGILCIRWATFRHDPRSILCRQFFGFRYFRVNLGYRSFEAFSDDLHSSKQIFDWNRCSTEQSGELTKTEKAIDGIFGFGRGPLSAVSQLSSREVIPKVFSHCLNGDGGGGGLLVLGEILEPNIVYTPLLPSKYVGFPGNTSNVVATSNHEYVLPRIELWILFLCANIFQDSLQFESAELIGKRKGLAHRSISFRHLKQPRDDRRFWNDSGIPPWRRIRSLCRCRKPEPLAISCW